MRVYLPSPDDYFSWLDSQGYAYVIMRGFLPFEERFPGAGSKHDIDMLVQDRAVAAIVARYGDYNKKQGTPCDVYDVSTSSEGKYLKRTYYPVALSRAMLEKRRLWKGRFYTPDPLHYILALTYHRLYRKKYPQSDVSYMSDTPFLSGLYAQEMSLMLEEIGEDLLYTPAAFEAFLRRYQCDISYADMASILQDFAQKRYVSRFFAQRCAGMRGEVKLSFLLHAKQVKEVEKNEQIIAIKNIRLSDKMKAFVKSFPLTTGRMSFAFYFARFCVVSFNGAPVKSTCSDPLVFYDRQFSFSVCKNEAEGLGLLPLCFSEEEQKELLGQIEVLRSGQSADGFESVSASSGSGVR